MEKNYADVIVDISHEKLDRPFTYRVPEEMREKITAGSAVRVPFGNAGREITGYVTGFRGTCELPPEKVKDIASLATDDETCEAHLVQLAAWMSRNYGSTMIKALKTVIPVRRKVSGRVRRDIALTDPDNVSAVLERYRKRRSAAKIRVVEALLAAGNVPVREISGDGSGKTGTENRGETTPGRIVCGNDKIPEGTSAGNAPAGSMEQIDLEKTARVSASVIGGMVEEGVLTRDSAPEYRSVLAEAKSAPPDILTAEQEEAVREIRREWSPEGENRPVLINGVTGSGKTLVYTELIADTLAAGKQAIVLIPEIALTWQTTLRFVKRFGNKVSFMHSRLSNGERYDQMKAARRGDVQVMVGPRSALFTPFPSLGLIVIDEEHEASYHSETMPRYWAEETAIARSRIEGARVVMGSATPSLSAARKAETGEYLGVRLRKRYGKSTLPSAEIVDMRRELEHGNRSVLSGTLAARIRETLNRGEQAMLFLNRRGYTGTVTCRSCGHVIKCPHCDVSLTKHKNGKLVCHYCGYETLDTGVCPECGSRHIGGLTVGTEQVQELVEGRFPEARVLRMDFDTTRGKSGHAEILKKFRDGAADILIGTQMIVKGHDFPNVTLVGVLLADLSLNDADYRSSERTYQLTAQAAGRAGRGDKPGRVVIQTYSPDHFSIVSAARQDYDSFYAEEFAFRKIMEYPPCGVLCAILGASENEDLLREGMRHIRLFIDRIDTKGRLKAIGPAPQAVGKVKDTFRRVIYIRSSERDKVLLAVERIDAYVAANRGFKNISIQYDIAD